MPSTNAPQIVFLDAGVANIEHLLDGLQPSVQAFVLDPYRDDLQQIAAILTAADLTDLSSVAIVANGDPGGMTLGSSLLGAADLADSSGPLAALGAAMAHGGTIQLYSPGLTASPVGQQFIDQFSTLTGATVEAASQFADGAPTADPIAEMARTMVLGVAPPPPAGRGGPNAVYDGAATAQAGADPTGQLWIGSSDQKLGHIDSDGNGVDVSDVNTNDANEFVEVQVDSADGLYFALSADGTVRVGRITNNTQIGQGTQTDSVEVEFQEGTRSSDEVRSFAVDPVNHVIYFSLYGQSQATTEILKVAYDPVAGTLLAARNGSGVMTSPYNATNGTFADTNDVLLTNSSTLSADSGNYGFVNAGAMYYDIANHDLYYLDDDFGPLNDGTGFNWNSTENIYVVSTAGSVGTSNPPTPTALITSGITPSPDANDWIGGMAVDTVNGKIYFTHNNHGTTTLDWIPITGGAATVMTLPGGITLGTVADEGFGSNPLAIDRDTQQLYIAEANNGTAPTQGEIIRLSLNAVGTGFLATGNTQSFTTTPTFTSGGGEDTGLTFYDLATLSGISGTTTEVVQGGGSVTLLTALPSISDADTLDVAGATVTVSNGQAGDELFVSGVQNGAVDGGVITVLFNSASHTLTLTGVASFAEYESLLSEVTFRDIGTDTTSVGHHPTRTIGWIVNNGLTVANPTTSDPNEGQTTLTIDRPPVQTTHGAAIVEGGSIATTLGDTDLDGDTVTVTGLTGGTVGSPDSGTYGTLTISANDSYTYSANNTTAINAAASGSHPTDSFTYTVGDGRGGSTLETLTITIDRPLTVSNIPGSAAVSAGGTITLAPSFSGTDPDSLDLTSATVMVTGGSAADVLTANTGGTSITASYDSATETLTLSGTDLLTNYEAVLESVAFHTTGAGGERTIAWQIDDNGQQSVVQSETLITACYCRGTRILTPHGEVPVEDLKIGDEVVTEAGCLRSLKWIGRRSYGGRFVMGRKDILPICIKSGALDDNVPRRDLWISPHHAMYLEGVLIEAKDLVNGVSIIQTERVEKVEYFHIELDAHDVIIAEGSLSESFIDDDSRGMFHNAHEYLALYPDVPALPARYCAPRREDGYEVEAARARIDKRAGLQPVKQDVPLGLRGNVDVVTPEKIAGWAQNSEYPEAPVCLDIYSGGRLIGQTLANRYRGDLVRAGLGSGCHSFEFVPPAGLNFAPDAVEVRRSLDGASLNFSLAYKTTIARHESHAA